VAVAVHDFSFEFQIPSFKLQYTTKYACSSTRLPAAAKFPP
jgi:hypothetical protein